MKLLPTSIFLTTLALTTTTTNAFQQRCLKPFNMGYCRSLFIRYKFDNSKGKCVQTVWGGCPQPDYENDNHFRSMRDCRLACHQ